MTDKVTCFGCGAPVKNKTCDYCGNKLYISYSTDKEHKSKKYILRRSLNDLEVLKGLLGYD